MKYKHDFANHLYKELEGKLDKKEIINLIEKPKHAQMGDMAFPCFELAKLLRKSPQLIASDIACDIESSLFEKIEAVGGYVNVFLNKQKVSSEIIKEIIKKQHHYGDLNLGNNGVVTIDFSSPNIAKPFSMGHLRSTVIGNALAHITEKCGYRVVRINHLGDWGTQFGKLITAYKKWGNEEEVKQNPIKTLLAYYVKFHDEAEKDSELENEGRYWFKKLEDGDQEAVKLWKWFRDESLKEFSRIYTLLNISFDSYHGEAFYNDKMDRIVQILEGKNLLVESDSAQVVPLENEDLPPCLIKKSDGATLYATRDLAAALYRQETYHFTKSLYVVGNEQSLHFKQVFTVLEKMGYKWASGMTHIAFGMMLKEGKKMSTRKGKVVLLEEVLEEAISLACQTIEEKNPSLQNKNEVAAQVGVGAVMFHDLKNYRMNDIEFSLEDMLKFDGETGPYVQYTHARACSLLRKGEFKLSNHDFVIDDDQSWPVVTMLREFPDVIERAVEKYDPSQIAKYVVDLSQAFNKYYGNVRILEEDGQKEARLAVVYTVMVVLKEGLRLLGISAPEEM
ncbi:arginine--tRNA ligase [Bacillus taeanensis]|uniref:Arginine--tRNA ligase n=1 Tax=Bacillus taeanensis TaxID=273032 RepID=A0A366XNS3_9BACI|nr:arginine--tRNA ligase [Bacillus taeanensis]RBW67557.1 arginine--tRNA ligase [Bacillus taeanensis]